MKNTKENSAKVVGYLSKADKSEHMFDNCRSIKKSLHNQQNSD
jgi:hypothetical protein